MVMAMMLLGGAAVAGRNGIPPMIGHGIFNKTQEVLSPYLTDLFRK